MSKTVVCRCEDVTLGDLQKALAEGYDDMEEIKRYTGFGTGPCQGKECLGLIARQLQRLGMTELQIAPFTSRPPLVPTALKFFAADDEDS